MTAWLAVALLSLILAQACSTGKGDQMTFVGTVMTGAQLGEVKNYCADGLYLVAGEGYLVGQTQMLLLRIADGTNQPKMLSDQQYVGNQVKVVGKYPAQEAFCEALICECEDFILVEQIRVTAP
jgi:hypothetical protein